MTNFEVATRVPLLIAAPGIKPSRTRALAELVDLYPTICELTGLELPPHLEGESLVESLRNPQQATDQVALSQYARFAERYTGRALRTERFRFVRWTETRNGTLVHRELYDHQTDPQETVNVADRPEYAPHVQRLEGRHRDAFQSPRD